MTSAALTPPFPYFGGKRAVAAEVWKRLGDPHGYVEPFFGGGAVLLGRPVPGRIETVNDIDGLLTNFWRAVKHDPAAVAAHCDYPISELDLHARHDTLIDARARVTALQSDPEWHDSKLAGWWAWGQSNWIGGGWGYRAARKIPTLHGAGGSGVLARALVDTDPAHNLRAYLTALAARLRPVRIVCGDWRRCLTPTVVGRHGLTAIFLDPPYAGYGATYGAADEVFAAVREWAVSNGHDRRLRIAPCGYDTGGVLPRDWSCYRWKANGGYGNRHGGAGNVNARSEAIWFSPHCLAGEG